MIKTDELLEEVGLLYQEKRYQEMVDLLNRAILEESSLPELYFYRGIACIQLGRYDNAIDDLTKAADLRPDHFRAYYQRGVAWSLKGKYNKAVSDLNHAIELRPDHVSSHRHLGTALTQLQDYDKAVEVFGKAIEMQPDNFELYHNRGSAWRKKGEFHKAIADYSKAAELKPDNDRTFFGLGMVYEAVKEFELASIHYKRAYFLGFNRTQLLKIFSEKLPALYIVKEILSRQEDDRQKEADLTTIEWLTTSCKTWDDFMDYVRSKNYAVSHPAKYYALEAVLNYYMGDSIKAWQIFDSKFDSDEYPYSLTLRDQYYLAVSALDFNEPDNGLAYAIGQARQAGAGPGDPMDRYYAGQLYLLYDDLDGALQQFDQCGVFLPALYGKAAIYRELGHAEELLQTGYKIAEIERISADGVRFLNGIKQVVITEDMSFEEMSDKIFGVLPYYELKGAVEEVRALMHRIPVHPHLEFHQLLRFDAPQSMVNS